MYDRGIGNLLFPLVAAGVLTNESVRPADVATSQPTCPNCKSKISLAFDWCPQCGTELKPMLAHVVTIKWKVTRGFALGAVCQQVAEENHEWFQYAKI